MILDHDNVAIFSLPRTGTKLLASIFEQFGYHNHGEWYSIRSTEIIDQKIVRLENPLVFFGTPSENKYKNISLYESRFEKFRSNVKNIVTIWPDAVCDFPFILEQLQNYYFISINRNPWDQILSFYISSRNYNFDANKISSSILFKKADFQKMYWDYFRATKFQYWLASKNRAAIIDFNELISGALKIFSDKKYIIDSKDEHSNLENLVQNLDEVRGWFTGLEKKRNEMGKNQ